MARKSRLREYRQRAGMTQMQLAEKCGIRQAHISLAENYGRGISIQSWYTLADLFDVDPRILAGWNEDTANEAEPETVSS